MKKALLLLSTSALLFAACSKDTASVVSREGLIPGKWKLNSYKITFAPQGSSMQFNIIDTMFTCQRDDLTEFTTAHEVYQDSGAEKCDSADSARTYVGTWKLVNSEKDLYLSTTNYGDVTFKVNEVTDQSLHLSKDTIVGYNGINFSGTADLIFRK